MGEHCECSISTPLQFGTDLHSEFLSDLKPWSTETGQHAPATTRSSKTVALVDLTLLTSASAGGGSTRLAPPFSRLFAWTKQKSRPSSREPSPSHGVTATAAPSPLRCHKLGCTPSAELMSPLRALRAVGSGSASVLMCFGVRSREMPALLLLKHFRGAPNFLRPCG